MIQVNTLNPSQIMLVQSFASLDKKADRDELMEVLKDFYARKLDEEMQRLWDEGIYDQNTLDELHDQHLRV